MKERGKAAVDMDFTNYSCSSEFPCQKHPSSSSVGICAYCLKDRLVKLVCSECGEQRLSSCSCTSDMSSSRRNSSATADVGSVGRMSFLLENDKTTDLQQQFNQKPPNRKGDHNTNSSKGEEVIVLRRSSSSCVEVKRHNGFWKIRRLFRKKKEKGCEKDGVFDDKSSDFYVPDVIMGVSRSRSLCSFRGGGYNDTDDSSDYRFSSAKISDFTGGIFFDYDKQCGQSGGESRRSGYRGPMEESEGRKSGFRGLFNEAEPRKSGCRRSSDVDNGVDMKGNIRRIGGPFELDRAYSVPHRSVFPVKESDFSAMDDSAFIDLKLDLSSDSKPELSAVKINEVSDYGANGGILRGNDAFLCDGGSCRISVNYDRGLKRGTNSYKVWKWLSRHYSGLRNSTKKNEIAAVKP
ncbi:OLC1v1032462C1 [Oldenlandia corymbosa var. corymbosa]|uniref:OLC1v1032462C1 n=1 Tax=Oldenlandia corymbosa var. corymbosa TaxID=529605 RepID=A0AAV1CMI7_OLDCO|nr:OLC1v1032462C1 [Oldenlandia corymbosa var. corymbosa]